MKWYIYLISVILIICGAFCLVRLYQLITANSYINGSFDIQNQFSQESFCYANTSVEFYHDTYDITDTYLYEVNLLKVEDFDGTKNRYEILLNGYALKDLQISNGAVFARANIDFYSVNGEMVCSTLLDISIKFLSDKSVLTLKTIGGISASFLTQYFKDNGIRLSINKIMKGGS